MFVGGCATAYDDPYAINVVFKYEKARWDEVIWSPDAKKTNMSDEKKETVDGIEIVTRTFRLFTGGDDRVAFRIPMDGWYENNDFTYADVYVDV